MVKPVPSRPTVVQPGGADRGGGGVGEVQQRDVDRRLHLVGDLVHGVGAEHQQLRAGGLQPGRLVGQHVAGLVPLAGDLQLLDLGEVDRGEHAARAECRPPSRSRTSSLASR